MRRDNTVPLFIAVCVFYVLNKLFTPLLNIPKHGPGVLGLGYYVILVIVSLVLGYLLYCERLRNWLMRPDCPGKDKWLSLLVTVIVFLALGVAVYKLLEFVPGLIWGRHLPHVFYDSLVGLCVLIGGGIAVLVASTIIGDRLYFRRIKAWLER